ncbi:MAG: DNA polymerase A family protein [Oligoflexales bacterium]
MAYLLDEYEPDLDEWIKYYYEESAPDVWHQVCYLWHLGKDLLPDIEQEDLFEAYKIDLSLVPIISAIENKGIRIDRKSLETELGVVMAQLNKLEAKIHETLGSNINANSPIQILNVLREDLALPIKSTQDRELRKHLENHEIIAIILEHRKLSKLYSTFLYGMYQDLNKDRVQTTFGMVNTVTGRLTSSDRNLQAVPPSVKKLFIPDAGKVFIYADYSQLELNLLANLSQDPNMIKVVNRGEDLHRSTASAVFGTPVSEIGDSERATGKQINYSIIYGSSPRTVADALKITYQQAKNFMGIYDNKFPQVNKIREEAHRTVLFDGFVTEPLGGRKRRFSNEEIEEDPNRVKRQAWNFLLQGQAASLLRRVMVSLVEQIPYLEINLQVHDSLLMSYPKDKYSESIGVAIKDTMENSVPLAVKLPVDMGIGNTWEEACKH